MMDYDKAYADGDGLFVFTTKKQKGLQLGVLVNTQTQDVGLEEPVDSIQNRLPYSDFKETDTPDEGALSLIKNIKLPEQEEM